MTGKLYIIAAPSGAGKSSLVKALTETLDNTVASISYTTRLPRPGEVHGEHYYFIETAEFESLIAQDAFLEYATVFSKIANRYYGTPRYWVEEQLQAGKNVILEIDWQGAHQVFKNKPGAIGIFILPPSLETLEERLQKRGQDEALVIAQRMSVAKDEIAHFKDYNYLVVNRDFEVALTEIQAIIKADPILPPWQNAKNAAQLQALVDTLLAS
jgi:guanylate kinase